MSSFIKLLTIHALALLLLVNCETANAFNDYYVDWPTSDPKAGTHTLAIVIDGCETLFKVKTEDLESFKGNKEALKQAIDTAIRRAETGCKK